MNDLTEAVARFRSLEEKRNLAGMQRKAKALKKKHGVHKVTDADGEESWAGDVKSYRKEKPSQAKVRAAIDRADRRDDPWARDHERHNTPTGQRLKKGKHKKIAGQRRGAPEKEQAGTEQSKKSLADRLAAKKSGKGANDGKMCWGRPC